MNAEKKDCSGEYSRVGSRSISLSWIAFERYGLTLIPLYLEFKSILGVSMAGLGEESLSYRSLTGQVIGALFQVYRELGIGFLESVYEAAFEIILQENDLRVDRQIPGVVWFRGSQVGRCHVDLIGESQVMRDMMAA